MTAFLVSPPNGAVLITVTDANSPQQLRAGGAAVEGEVVAFCGNKGDTWCWVELHVAGKWRFRQNVPPDDTVPAWVGPIGQNQAVTAYAQTANRVEVVLQGRPVPGGDS